MARLRFARPEELTGFLSVRGLDMPWSGTELTAIVNRRIVSAQFGKTIKMEPGFEATTIMLLLEKPKRRKLKGRR